jgi:hypothetical protein
MKPRCRQRSAAPIYPFAHPRFLTRPELLIRAYPLSCERDIPPVHAVFSPHDSDSRLVATGVVWTPNALASSPRAAR